MEKLTPINTPELPAPRGGCTLVPTPDTNTTFNLLAGAGRAGQYHDQWDLVLKLPNKQCEWHRLVGQNHEIFGDRSGHSSIFDPKHSQMIIFGGQDFVANKHFDEMYRWDFNEKRWDEVTVAASTEQIEERNSHAVAIDKQAGVFYVYGGANRDGPKNDLWRFDLAENEWSRVSVTGVVPDGREMHTMEFVELADGKKCLYVLGGRTLGGIDDKVYRFEIEEAKWTEVGVMPTPCCAHSSAVVGDTIYMYGGTNGQEFFDTIYGYSIESDVWYQSMIASGTPARISAVMVALSDDRHAILFGGSGMEGDYNDVYVLDTNKFVGYNNMQAINKNQFPSLIASWRYLQ